MSRHRASARVSRTEAAVGRYTLQTCYIAVTDPVQGLRSFRPVVAYPIQKTGEFMRSYLIVAAVISLGLPVRVAAQVISTGPIAVKLGGRINYQFNTTSISDEELRLEGVDVAIPGSTFEMRRLWLTTDVAFEDWLSGELELDFAQGRLRTRNAFINFEVDPAFQLRAGQLKKPFSLLELTSSSKWPVIERGVRIRGLGDALRAGDVSLAPLLTRVDGDVLLPDEQDLLAQLRYSSFDLGAEVHGGIGRFAYAVGVFNGAGSDELSDTDAKAFAGRATIAIARNTPFVIGFGLSRSVFRDGPTADAENSGLAWEADLQLGEFRRPGLQFLAEVAGGDNLAVSESNFLGAQGVLAFFRPVAHPRIEGWEVAGRASYGDPRRDVDGDAGVLLTPGFNLYFSGRNRLMLNWDVFLPESDRFSREHALRAQAQIYF